MLRLESLLLYSRFLVVQGFCKASGLNTGPNTGS